MASRTFDVPFDLYKDATYFGNYSKLTWNTNVVKGATGNDVQASIYTLGRIVILQFGCCVKTHDNTVDSPETVAWLPKELMPYAISRSVCCNAGAQDTNPLVRYCGVSVTVTDEHPYGALYINTPYWSTEPYMFGAIVYFRKYV